MRTLVSIEFRFLADGKAVVNPFLVKARKPGFSPALELERRRYSASCSVGESWTLTTR